MLHPRAKAPRGRQSRSCVECKRRRVKCRLERPSCLRCIKAGLACSGSIRENESFFFHENQSTVSQWHPRTYSRSPAGYQLVQFVPPQRLLPQQVVTPTEEAAVDIFLNYGVEKFRKPDGDRGYVDLLIPYWTKANKDDTLSKTLKALALHSHSKDIGFRPLHSTALTHYGRAISIVSEAIQTPSKAYTYDTIMAVMTLTIFEMMSDDVGAVQRYTHHLEGAFALVKARSELAASEDTQLVAWALRPQLVGAAIYLCLSHLTDDQVTYRVMQETKATTPASEDDDPAVNRPAKDVPLWKLMLQAAVKVAPLRARADAILSRDRETVVKDDVVSVMEEASSTVDYLRGWFRTLEGEHITRELTYDPPEALEANTSPAWPGPIREYTNVSVCGILNKYRGCHLVLLCIVLRCKAWLSHACPDYFPFMLSQPEAKDIQHVTNEICASLPFMLGMNLDALASNSSLHENPHTRHHGGGAMMMIWNMFCATNIETIPLLQRTWIRARMRHIADRFGFGNATLMADHHESILGKMKWMNPVTLLGRTAWVGISDASELNGPVVRPSRPLTTVSRPLRSFPESLDEQLARADHTLVDRGRRRDVPMR